MPLSNWSIFKNGNPAIGITTTVTTPTSLTPITGTGSLLIQHFSIADKYVNLYNTTSLEIGLIKGRIRSIFRPHSINGAGTQRYSAGFVFMQSQFNVSGGAGNCYFAHLAVRNNGTLAQFYIRKFVATGLQGGTLGTVLYAGPTLGTILGQNICLEVEWNSESGTQCDITLRRALNTTNFASLVLETTMTDASSPFVTSVAEGIGTTNGSASGAMLWLCDTTNLKKLL